MKSFLEETNCEDQHHANQINHVNHTNHTRGIDDRSGTPIQISNHTENVGNANSQIPNVSPRKNRKRKQSPLHDAKRIKKENDALKLHKENKTGSPNQLPPIYLPSSLCESPSASHECPSSCFGSPTSFRGSPSSFTWNAPKYCFSRIIPHSSTMDSPKNIKWSSHDTRHFIRFPNDTNNTNDTSNTNTISNTIVINSTKDSDNSNDKWKAHETLQLSSPKDLRTKCLKKSGCQLTGGALKQNVNSACMTQRNNQHYIQISPKRQKRNSRKRTFELSNSKCQDTTTNSNTTDTIPHLGKSKNGSHDEKGDSISMWDIFSNNSSPSAALSHVEYMDATSLAFRKAIIPNSKQVSNESNVDLNANQLCKIYDSNQIPVDAKLSHKDMKSPNEKQRKNIAQISYFSSPSKLFEENFSIQDNCTVMKHLHPIELNDEEQVVVADQRNIVPDVLLPVEGTQSTLDNIITHEMKSDYSEIMIEQTDNKQSTDCNIEIHGIEDDVRITSSERLSPNCTSGLIYGSKYWKMRQDGHIYTNDRSTFSVENKLPFYIRRESISSNLKLNNNVCTDLNKKDLPNRYEINDSDLMNQQSMSTNLEESFNHVASSHDAHLNEKIFKEKQRNLIIEKVRLMLINSGSDYYVEKLVVTSPSTKRIDERPSNFQLQEIRNNVRKLIREKNLVTRIYENSPQKYLDRRFQVNLDLYTDENLLKRHDNKFSKWVLHHIILLWKDLKKENELYLTKSTYIDILQSVYQIVCPEMNIREYAIQAEEDWKKDSKGANHISLSQFREAIFLLIDLWTPTAEEEDYVTFIQTLHKKLRFYSSDSVMKKNLISPYIPNFSDLHWKKEEDQALLECCLEYDEDAIRWGFVSKALLEKGYNRRYFDCKQRYMYLSDRWDESEEIRLLEQVDNWSMEHFKKFAIYTRPSKELFNHLEQYFKHSSDHIEMKYYSLCSIWTSEEEVKHFEFLQSQNRRKKRNIDWDQLSRILPKKDIYHCVRKAIPQSTWTMEEDIILLHGVRTEPDLTHISWRNISQQLKWEKTKKECKSRFTKQFLNWEKSEDEILLNCFRNMDAKLALQILQQEWESVELLLPTRSLPACAFRLTNLLNYWSREDDCRLFSYIGRSSLREKDWNNITSPIIGKHPAQCKDRYKERMASWTEQDDSKLEQTFTEEINKTWGNSSTLLNTRTREECCVRLLIANNNWVKEEDDQLLFLYKSFDSNWSLIGENFHFHTLKSCMTRLEYLKQQQNERKITPTEVCPPVVECNQEIDPIIDEDSKIDSKIVIDESDDNLCPSNPTVENLDQPSFDFSWMENEIEAIYKEYTEICKSTKELDLTSYKDQSHRDQDSHSSLQENLKIISSFPFTSLREQLQLKLRQKATNSLLLSSNSHVEDNKSLIITNGKRFFDTDPTIYRLESSHNESKKEFDQNNLPEDNSQIALEQQRMIQTFYTYNSLHAKESAQVYLHNSGNQNHTNNKFIPYKETVYMAPLQTHIFEFDTENVNINSIEKNEQHFSTNVNENNKARDHARRQKEVLNILERNATFGDSLDFHESPKPRFLLAPVVSHSSNQGNDRVSSNYLSFDQSLIILPKDSGPNAPISRASRPTTKAKNHGYSVDATLSSFELKYSRLDPKASPRKEKKIVRLNKGLPRKLTSNMIENPYISLEERFNKIHSKVSKKMEAYRIKKLKLKDLHSEQINNSRVSPKKSPKKTSMNSLTTIQLHSHTPHMEELQT